MGHADISQKQNSRDSLSRVYEIWAVRLGSQLSNNCSYNSFDYKSTDFEKQTASILRWNNIFHAVEVVNTGTQPSAHETIFKSVQIASKREIIF